MKVLKRFVAVGLFAGLCFAVWVWGTPRTRTSPGGKPVVADVEPEQARSGTVQDLLGLNRDVSIVDRRWEQWKDYYNESDMRRCALALDALTQLRKDYNVDENRVYIGGTSGGGAESTFATFLWPQDFRAAFNSVRGFELTSSSCLPFADESDMRAASKNQQPFAFVSGPQDFCYKSMPGSEQNFRDHGFVVRFFDIPGMRHETASPETFDPVMAWVEANNPRL